MRKVLLPLLLTMSLLVSALGLAPVPVRGEGFVVNSSDDGANAHDWLPGDGMCVDSLWRCTLRAAIEEANAWPGADTITFDSAMYIQVDTTEGPLPQITGPLRIDAGSAWNTADDQPGVTLSGDNQSFTGLKLGPGADGSEIYGLLIINFLNAVEIRSADNAVGGRRQKQRNVINSNGGYGISIYGPDAHHNVVQGNWIGLSITGDTKQANDGGVRIAGGAYENTIGGALPDEGNVISGNAKQGISILEASHDNRLGGNLIGLPAVGSSQDVGNGGVGVYIYNGPQNTQVGSSGGDPAGNLIAYNGNAGVILWSADNNWVEGNVIVENKAAGVYIKDSAHSLALSNVIAHNAQTGVYVGGATAIGNTILANSIHHNGFQGIRLVDGGNAGLAAPTIAAADANGASGTGCANCTVHLFSDLEDEGEIYEGFASVGADGTWSYTGPLGGPHVTATITDLNGNTSEFSAPFNLPHTIFLPAVVRN